MTQKTFFRGRRRKRLGQTLVEYSLLLSMISLIAISGLEELGVHIKGSNATAVCALIWAENNTGTAAGVNKAFSEIQAFLNASFKNTTAEQAMKNKVLAEQTKLKNKFLPPS